MSEIRLPTMWGQTYVEDEDGNSHFEDGLPDTLPDTDENEEESEEE